MLTGDHSISGSGGIIALLPRTTKIDQKTAKKNHEELQKKNKKRKKKKYKKLPDQKSQQHREVGVL